MRIILHVHGDKESSYAEAEKAGLTGEALKMAMYLAYEHKMEYEVDPQSGEGKLISVDGRELAK